MSITVSQQFVKVFESQWKRSSPIVLGVLFLFLGVLFVVYFFFLGGGVLVVLLCFCLFVLFCFVLVFGGFFCLVFFFVDKTRLSPSEIVAHIFPNWKIWTFSRNSYLASAFTYLWWHMAKVMCSCIYLFLLCVRIDFESRCQCINSKTR